MENVISNISFTDFELELKDYAKEYNVPIIKDDGLVFLEAIIALYKPKKILEIGTAIAYSAIRMNKVCGSQIYTIERSQDMYDQATKNVEKAGKNGQIHIIFKDALEAFDDLKDNEFDMIFIDAAKAQYINFFNLYTPLLSKGGIVVCDNMYFHGLVAATEQEYNEQSRSVRGLIRKLRAFHEALLSNQEYDTSIYPIGDGMSISIKKEK